MIDLDPGRRPLPPHAHDDGPDGPRRQWGVWRTIRYVAASPFAAVPFRQIADNGRSISDMAHALRRRRLEFTAIPVRPDGGLDKAALAAAYGIGAGDLAAQLHRRRRFTGWTAYAALGLGCVFLTFWLLRLLASASASTGERVMVALQFAPFCLVFFLLAFRQAHANWQIRADCFGSVGDYLRSPAPFWPRL